MCKGRLKMILKKYAFALAFLLITGTAHSAAINSLEITGGSFSMSGTNDPLNPAAFANMTLGGYDGSAPAFAGDQASFAATSIATAEFGFFGPIAIYTAESDGIRSGFSAPSGDITNNNLTLDLSAWTMYWNGASVNFGSSSNYIDGSICVGSTGQCTTAILTSYDDITGNFSASWDAVMVGGWCNGCLSSWTVNGTVSAVPVPAAVWLLGSGLIGLAAFSRRKKV